MKLFIYSNNENLVLKARSEMNGCAVNSYFGMMEYWNVGILGMAELSLYFIDGTD